MLVTFPALRISEDTTKEEDEMKTGHGVVTDRKWPPDTHSREGALRGGCWVRAPLFARGAGLGGVARQGGAYPAALRGRRHQCESVVQQGVHLLPGLLDRGLGGHVGRRG